MSRILLKISARAKSAGLVDSAVRYNARLSRRIGKTLCATTPVARATETGSLSRRVVDAARHTRYGVGRSERLADWPILSRQQVLAAPGDFVSRRTLIRVPAATGGTTGAPMRLWRSAESIVAEQLFLDEMLATHGLSMRSRMAVLRADTVKPAAETGPPYGRLSHGGLRLTLSSPHLSAATLRWYVEALQRVAPSIQYVYPSAIINLLRLMEQAGLSLSIPVILASSELLSAPMHATLERFFNASVINYYGQAERVCLEVSRRPGQFFFHPLYGKVELETAADAAAHEPRAVKIIATGFWNTVMPLIRYDTGDLIHLPGHFGASELAEIARGERPFGGLAGRTGEFLLTREGLRIIGLNHIPRGVANICQVQLVQTGWDALNVDVLATPQFSDTDARTLHAQACAKLPASFTVTVRRVDKLRQTTAGKTPFVIREL